MLPSYEETITVLKEKGQVEIAMSDCDLQFFIEDTLESLNLKYRKLVPPRKRTVSNKVLIIEIVNHTGVMNENV